MNACCQDRCITRAATDVAGAKDNFKVGNASIGKAHSAKKAVELALVGDEVPSAFGASHSDALEDEYIAGPGEVR